ncbi:hypothetical protein SAMN02745213_00514 [Succinivibrio dextrinosolvens DSM 3072]|uniref:Uncharacterized protein n=1 Tax=Succinivibrio dextrinosolvens DSM 3072 TaxID=1123324 RepID=A0A1T4V1D6_9GAMM|nr:hypothetical protein [Succinivibrio dextrinosolvens]SKA58707.1 hypothetical protein SAMN02745213_00514 [Succinivibrio dextrinosolvens DSM 3072]
MFREPRDMMEYASDVTLENFIYGLILLGVLWIAYQFLIEFIFEGIKKISDFIKKFLD